MRNRPHLKTALLAAASLTAATAAVAHAAAAPPPPVAIEHMVTAADAAPERTAPAISGKSAGLAALAAAALAGLARFIGLGRIKSALAVGAAAAGEAASAGLAATQSAVKAVGRVIASPFRAVALFAGLAVVALAGVGLYDVEWAGGAVIGALFTAALILGVGKLRKMLVPARLGGSR